MLKIHLQPFGRALLLAVFLPWLAAGICVAAESMQEHGAISGCIELAGQGTYRGVASLWPAIPGKEPDPRRAIRPPAVSRALGTDGCFTLQAQPGEYFVGAVVRMSDGGSQGPPRPGDMIFLSPDAADGHLKAAIHPGKTTDIGRHASGWRYTGFSPTAMSITISGTLTGTDGKPRAGLLVFAFTDSAMSSEPLAVSEPSDSNGRYLLRLPEPATVYLRAREHYGRRSPADGGYMGIYGEGKATPVSVDSHGDKQARDLRVILVPPLNRRQKAAASVSPPREKN